MSSFTARHSGGVAGMSAPKSSSGARAWTAAVIPPKSDALDEAAAALGAALTASGTKVAHVTHAGAPKGRVLRAPWTDSRGRGGSKRGGSSGSSGSRSGVEYVAVGGVLLVALMPLAVKLWRRHSSSRSAASTATSSTLKAGGGDSASETPGRGSWGAGDGDTARDAQEKRGLAASPERSVVYVQTRQGMRRMESMPARSPAREGTGEGTRAASPPAASWLPSRDGRDGRDGATATRAESPGNGSLDTPGRSVSLTRRVSELQHRVQQLTSELKEERTAHMIEADVLKRDAHAAFQALLRQQRATRRFVERVEGEELDESELTFDRLDESVASIGSQSGAAIMDDISFERLLVRIAAAGGESVGEGEGILVDGDVASPNGGGDVYHSETHVHMSSSRRTTVLHRMAAADGRDDEIIALRSQVERLAGLNALLQQRLSSVQRQLRDAQALVGDLGTSVPESPEELRSRMSLTLALLKGEVISLDWPGLELVSRLLGEMKAGARAAAADGRSGSEYLRAFDAAFGAIRAVVESVAGEQHPGQAWSIPNIDEMLADMPVKSHKTVFKAMQRLVVAYDALPNATRNHLESAQELVVNCHAMLELARFTRFELAAKKANRALRRTAMPAGEEPAGTTTPKTTTEHQSLVVSTGSLPPVPTTGHMVSPAPERRLNRLLAARPTPEQMRERRLLHP